VRLKVREIRGTHKATISLKVCWKRLFWEETSQAARPLMTWVRDILHCWSSYDFRIYHLSAKRIPSISIETLMWHLHKI
jgi:hypothetical protein